MKNSYDRVSMGDKETTNKTKTQCNQIQYLILLISVFVWLGLLTFQQKGADQKFKLNEDKNPQLLLNQDHHIQQTQMINVVQQPNTKIDNDANEEKQPAKYSRIDKVESFQQLPLCILSINVEKEKILDIYQSIKSQNYQNYRFLQLANESSQYLILIDAYKEKCDRRSVILLANIPLINNSLHKLNQIYQTRKVWMTYYENNVQFGITSFYPQLLQNVINNDFHKKTARKIEWGHLPTLYASLKFLAHQHAAKIKLSHFYQTPTFSHESLFHFYFAQNMAEVKIGVTQPMFRLDQNYPINLTDYQQGWKKMMENSEGRYRAVNNISQVQMLQAIQSIDAKSLPVEHAINQRQRVILQEKYGILNYQKQLPLCVVVPSSDNQPNQRYRHLLQTISQQQYSNYRLIFIDDASEDNTFELTSSLVEGLGIKDKATLIRNPQKKYATYNIKKAVQLCGKKDIVVLIDGDDQIVGKQVFKLINMAYQKEDIWIMYTNYFMSNFKYGGSRVVDEDYFKSQKREKKHFMSPLRTFYAELFRRIQEKDHKNADGRYLTTLYDEAMQYPMIQMAGYDRIRYIPELTYLYNTGYGNNDDANGYKFAQRKKNHDDIVRRPKYARLPSLFDL